MNDIQKLQRVINSLEEQSAQVEEFNGLLRAVNDARIEIEAAKSTLENLATEQGALITKNSNKFEEFENRLTLLNDLLRQIQDDQLKLRREVAALMIVTPEQLEDRLRPLNDLSGQIKDEQLNLRREVAALKFVTPNQFEQGRAEIDSFIAKQFAELSSQLEAAAGSQKRSINELQIIVIIGLFVLAGGVGYLALSMVI